MQSAEAEPRSNASSFATRFGRIHAATVGDRFSGPSAASDAALLERVSRCAAAARRRLPRDRDGYARLRGFAVARESARRDFHRAFHRDLGAAAFALLDALGEREFAVVGHHTGAVIAAEMAAAAPDRVRVLVLSACPFVDAARRAKHHGMRVIDDVEARADGSISPSSGRAVSRSIRRRHRPAATLHDRRPARRPDGGRRPSRGESIPDGGPSGTHPVSHAGD